MLKLIKTYLLFNQIINNKTINKYILNRINFIYLKYKFNSIFFYSYRV